MISIEFEEALTQMCGAEDITCEEFIEYLVVNKEDAGLTWTDIANLVLKFYDEEHGESYYRKKYGTQKSENIENKLAELQKERLKLSDERTQLRAYMRRISREETLKEIAVNAVEALKDVKQLIPPKAITSSYNPFDYSPDEALLMLSDWHYGIEVDCAHNKYNPDICQERLACLREEVLDNCETHGVKELHIMNLADLIAGRIHLTIRLESRYDVITQVMHVSEMLAEFMSSISGEFEHIHYYSCTDNHSRIEPIKSDSLDLESLCRITDWYLQERLQSYKNIIFHKNTFGDDIISATIKGHTVLGCHGDKDRVSTIAEKLTLFTRKPAELICCAHLHHFQADEHTGCVVIANGSLMGTDDYATKLRLHSKPSQNLIIISDDNPLKAIYRIVL